MTVVAIGRTSSDLDQVAQETGAYPLVLEVRDPAAVEEAFGRLAVDHGVPDLLVNNAGISGGVVSQAREAGVSWSAIGGMLGTSGEAVRKRYGGQPAKTA